MLIKKSIVEKWYQTDSWVFKNFSYLFKNPLWSKRIPNGFSVCPYFWMSIFSLFVFRPFIVFPIQYFILPIMKFIGKPARVADEFMFNMVKRILNVNSDYMPAVGILGSVAILILVSCMGGLILVIGVNIYEFYNYITVTHAGTFVFWSMASFVSLFGIITTHKAITKTECKTMYYLFVWLALFIPAVIFIVPTETWSLVSSVASRIAGIAADGFGLLWFIITFLATWVWYGIKVFVTWTPVEAFMLPWWGYFIILGIIGWIVSKCTVYVEEKNINTLRQENPAEFYAGFRSAWLNVMIRLVMIGKRWKNGDVFNENFDNFTVAALRTFNHKCIRDSIELLHSKELDELQKYYPLLKKCVWEQVSNDEISTESRFERYKNGLVNGSDAFPSVNGNTLITVLKSVVEKDTDVKNLAKVYREKDLLKQSKKEARRTSWSHVTCLKVTRNIAKTVHDIGRGLKTVGSNTMTFTAYMWMLIKAKKQGACPYFKFNAPTPTINPLNTTEPK